MPIRHLLYLHGFRSSPQSAKARQVAAWMHAHRPKVQWWCPQLPPSPRAAAELIAAGSTAWLAEEMAVIGSSLGGFYATWLAQRRGCKAAVLNPAVHPARDLAGYIGDLTAWHDPAQHFYFRPEYVDELRALETEAGPMTAPERYFALIARGDEVLNWREMAARYAGATIQLLPGGDHALSDFAPHMPGVLGFLGLTG